MKFNYIYVFLLSICFFSCKNENEKRHEESIKDQKKKELIFSNIEKGWNFNVKSLTSSNQTNSWNEWNSFLTELDQKPKKTIRNFQIKSAELSKKVMTLNNYIPQEFNIPQMKSRIAILITKVRMLDLYINLSTIPDQKVIALVPEINQQITALQNQMNEIQLKSKIPIEEGESELLRMLDTTRAIPNTPDLDPNTPRVD